MCITIFCTFLCRPPKLNDYNVKFPSRFYGEHEHKTVTVFLFASLNLGIVHYCLGPNVELFMRRTRLSVLCSVHEKIDVWQLSSYE